MVDAFQTRINSLSHVRWNHILDGARHATDRCWNVGTVTRTGPCNTQSNPTVSPLDPALDGSALGKRQAGFFKGLERTACGHCLRKEVGRRGKETAKAKNEWAANWGVALTV